MIKVQKYSFSKIKLFLFPLLVTCLLACNNIKSKRNANESRIDTLLSHAKDSLFHNNTFSKQQLKLALTLAKDSDSFYKVFSDYTSYYFSINSYDTAYVMSKRLLKYASKHSVSPSGQSMLTSANNYLGNYYSQMNKFDSSICYYKIAYQHGYLQSDRTALPDICINLGDMYTRKGNYINGITYFRKALFISDSLHILDKMGFPIYFGLGQAYYTGMRNFELSDTYFKMAEKQLESRSLNEKFVFCNNRGNFYYYKEEYVHALPWFLKAKAIVEQGKYEYSINLCDVNLGDIYLHLNKLDSAEYFLDKSYAYFQQKKIDNMLYYIATVKAGVALKQNNAKKAFGLLQQFSKVVNVEPTILSIRNKYLQDYYVKVGNYKQAYQYQLNNIRQDDSIRTDRMNNRIAEVDMRFKQDTALVKRKYLIDKQAVQIHSLRLTNFFFFFIVAAFIVMAILAYVNFKRKRDLQRAKFVEANAKLRLQNIRNRISPHFIFNVLNREISSEEDKEKHQQMIGLVRFLRRSLEITEQTSVTLEEELEFVRNYLQMEQKSLGDEFHIHWNIDSCIDTDRWRIPAMIMQIPIENAMKHALRAKEGEKLLNISISKEAAGIQITIQDNGAGYHPEKQLQTKGTGTGLKVLYQTIDILNTKNNEKISLNIEDVKDKGASGTRAKITVPDEYNFEV